MGEKMETVAIFIFLGSKITVDSDCSHEIKRCLLLGRKAMTNLDNILRSRDTGKGNGNPLHYSCLEKSMDRGAWQTAVHGVTKSQTWLSRAPVFFMGKLKKELWRRSQLRGPRVMLPAIPSDLLLCSLPLPTGLVEYCQTFYLGELEGNCNIYLIQKLERQNDLTEEQKQEEPLTL